MSCCQCQGIEALFNDKTAVRDLKDYRWNGPDKTTVWLIEALKAEGGDDLTLLDIGGGIGAIQHDLLKANVAKAIHVDASTAYLEASKQEAERQGHVDRVSYRYGDFVSLAPELTPADIVTLDRVICCYHDMETLVGLSSAGAGKLYGVVLPRDTWWTRLGGRLFNFVWWLIRHPYRFFVHPITAVEAVIRQNGLKRHFYRKSFLWYVAIYSRGDAEYKSSIENQES
jgi:hypothetical protein